MGTPHLAWPLTVTGTGGFATLEQDSPAEIAACVAVCLLTDVGSRVEVPEYGAPRSEFGRPDPGDLLAAVLEWEPRADLTVGVLDSLGDSGDLTVISAAVAPHV